MSTNNPTADAQFSELVSMIWAVAELLRGDFKQSEYGRVILPLTVLRRLDQAFEPKREEVLKLYADLNGKLPDAEVESLIKAQTNLKFYNSSKWTFKRLLEDPTNLAVNLDVYVNGLSTEARTIFGPEGFELARWVERLESADLTYQVMGEFAKANLSPERVDEHTMGRIFEELIRRWAEASGETAGEHFTPREVIKLMVNLLFLGDEGGLTSEGAVRSVYDCACGTGGMLQEADNHIGRMNTDAELLLYGQELNGESYAICVADMLIKNHEPSNIHLGNSFTADGTRGMRFDYLITNPPFGVDWKKVQDHIVRERELLGYDGRFGAGLPRTSDGSLLFLQHLVSKMKDPEEDRGSRIAIVFNGSPLFSGGAGSGESEIRRWIIEQDLLEGIVALPDQLFHNTGIHTYVWVLSNRKPESRRGKVELVDARGFFSKMRRSLGSKRNELSPAHIEEITRLYANNEPGEFVQIRDAHEFGYQRVCVERPLRLRYVLPPRDLEIVADARSLKKLTPDDRSALVNAFSRAEVLDTTDAAEFDRAFKKCVANSGVSVTAAQLKPLRDACHVRDPEAPIVTNRKGQPEPDPELRDYENVPLAEDIDEYMRRQVLPHVPDAWVKDEEPKIGYEIPFTRFFYRYEPPRAIEEVDAEIRELEARIQDLLGEALA